MPRGFIFTINNHTFDDCTRLLDMPSDYLLIGFEVGDGGTPHIQGYCYFKQNRTRKWLVKSYLPRAHVELANGDHSDNRTYIIGPYDKNGKHKDYNPDNYEFGEVPQSGRITFEKMKEVMANPKDNFHLFHQYRKTYSELKNLEIDRNKIRKLSLIPIEKQFELAAHYADIVFLDTSEYNSNYAVIVPCYAEVNKIIQWSNGYPPNYKYGYEIKNWDPTYIFITYSDIKEYNYLIKMFADNIDHVWLEGTTIEEFIETFKETERKEDPNC